MADESRAQPNARAAAKLLVVDDNGDYRDMLRAVLEDEGYRVHTAANGHVALDLLLAGRIPDLILVDLLMPEMDGATLIAEMKARPALSLIPVVAMAGDSGHVVGAALVCEGYLRKPIGADEVLAVVDHCLSRRVERVMPTRRLS
jgi:CheY-like chemotaxis protein